ncbi:MAG: hypothetical protein WDA10_08370 [Porticoccaceae bacterium]
MSCSHNIRKALIFSAAFCLGSTVMANECGEPPAAPPLVDGATATMEAVVANSDEVKVYIADADKYLDCREAAIATEGFTALDKSAQDEYRAANKTVLDARNAIGEDFNKEVAAFKKANP